ncbi:MAG: hypothetical protein JRN06_10850 [Nitrososphaerota archaeon]|nr:hypothetical protein [Nitrososphaerota archaeon]
MVRPWLVILGVSLLLLTAAPSAFAYASSSLVLNVYPDGYVLVAQTLTVDSNATSIVVPLLSPAVSDLVATDQNGSPLSYGFASGGENMTIYTLGATQLTVKYDTNGLTSKNGTVWTLAFASDFNSTVVLPQLSSLTSVSGTPYSIKENGASPELALSAGPWEIGYGVSIEGVASPTQGLGLFQLFEAGTLVAAAVAGGVLVWWWRGRGLGPVRQDLRPDDVQVLNFIREKGGKVLEPEIRMRFALPKTSAWRQIKRLERGGYLKVTKIGSQNQIELLKNREPGA